MRFRICLAVALAMAVIVGAITARAETYAGHPVVIDGDTIKIGRYKIRLHGIDAPEINQPCYSDAGLIPCGQISKAKLVEFIDQNLVFCRIQGRGKYGRFIGKCFIGEHDLQAAMVQAGWAVAYLQYSHDYKSDQTRAWLNNAGMWAYRFDFPDQWRRAKR